MKRIQKIDKNGNVVKSFKSIEAAALEAKVSTATIKRQLKGEVKKTHCGYTWKYSTGNKNKGIAPPQLQDYYAKNSKSINIVDKDGNILRSYSSMRKACDGEGFSMNQMSKYLTNRVNKENFIRRYGIGFEYADNEENEEVIENKTTQSSELMYINLLVGLVNQTLIEGATYSIDNQKLTYNKEQGALINEDGFIAIKRDTLIDNVKVELPLLTKEEKMFLFNVLKGFGKIKSIRKCQYFYAGYEYLRLEADNSEFNIDLDAFKEGKYYTGLKLDKSYTLKELGL